MDGRTAVEIERKYVVAVLEAKPLDDVPAHLDDRQRIIQEAALEVDLQAIGYGLSPEGAQIDHESWYSTRFGHSAVSTEIDSAA